MKMGQIIPPPLETRKEETKEESKVDNSASSSPSRVAKFYHSVKYQTDNGILLTVFCKS